MTGTIWLAPTADDRLRAEAAVYPREETGGMLLGYMAGADAVVVAIIGPGPGAKRTATTFLPDAAWQQERLIRAYADSGRTVGYLGDWHTHPGGVPALSRRDRRTLRKIAGHRPARQSRPLSAVLAPGPDEILAFWQQLQQRWAAPQRIPVTLCDG